MTDKYKINFNCNCDKTDSPKNLICMPGGGYSAILLGHGILLAMHKMGILEKDDGEYNTDNIFAASSGSTMPLLLVMICFNLELNKKYPHTWFNRFVTKTIHKYSSLLIIKVYGVSQLQSFMDENFSNNILNTIMYSILDNDINSVLPDEFKNKPGIDFSTSQLNLYFNFNYIKVVDNYLPLLTTDQTDISKCSLVTQIKQIFRSCCTINGFSQTRPFQNHDAGLLVPNFINCLESYLDITTLQNILYFTLNSYDTNSFKKLIFKNTLNYISRNEIEACYFMIEYTRKQCLNKKKYFDLICPPNKYYTPLKFNVPLYTDLQNLILYDEDFNMIERFLCTYPFPRDNEKMKKLITLFGYYECLYAFKTINETNEKKKEQLEQIDYNFVKELKYDKNSNDVIVDTDKPNIFYLNSIGCIEKIPEIVNIIKYKRIISPLGFEYAELKSPYTLLTPHDGGFLKGQQMFDIKMCFIKDCEYKEDEMVEVLQMYLTYMQTNIDVKPDAKYYTNSVPIQEITNDEIFENPRKFLRKDYKYVSDNCLTIYYPFRKILENFF